jgi:hypothetical protein
MRTLLRACDGRAIGINWAYRMLTSHAPSNKRTPRITLGSETAQPTVSAIDLTQAPPKSPAAFLVAPALQIDGTTISPVENTTLPPTIVRTLRVAGTASIGTLKIS